MEKIKDKNVEEISTNEMVDVQYLGTQGIKTNDYKWTWQQSQTVPLTVANELCKSKLFIKIKNIKEKIEVEE